MALEGIIKEFGLADIFQLIGQQKKTGILTLTANGEKVAVSYERGAIVWAESSKRETFERLGQVLIKSGRITGAQLEDALKLQKETLQKIGHVLVTMGAIDHQALKDALSVQILDTVYQLFRWTEGHYLFSQENVSYDTDLVTHVSAEHVLMEGVRMMDEWPLIEEMIPSMDLIYRIKENAESLTSRLRADEEQVIMLVDGARNVQDVIDASGMPEFDACKILLVLEHAGLIEKTGEERAEVSFAPKERVPGMERMAGFGQEIAVFAVMLLLVFAMMLKNFGMWPFSAAGGPFTEVVTQTRLEKLRMSVDLYRLQKGDYPQSLAELASVGLVSEKILTDAAGQPFHYEIQEKGATVSKAR